MIKKYKDRLSLAVNQAISIPERQHELLYNERKIWMDHSMLDSAAPGITTDKIAPANVTVSLTTYGKRLWEVYITIESLMRQTMQPNRIVLWLDNGHKGQRLPMSLKRQIDRGLEVKYTDDLKSYKKLVPALKEYPDDAIITFDDDAIYNVDLIERLVTAYCNDPTHIHAGRAHKIKLGDNGRPVNYNDWQWYTTDTTESPLIFPTGVGGVLYPPHSLSDEVLNTEAFMRLAPNADDIWFKAMALLNGTISKKIPTRDPRGEEYLVNESVQDIGLIKVNLNNNGNDRQLKAVFDHYNLYDKLSSH